MNNLQPFKLERYFAEYEFSAPYLLSPSDCESYTLSELLALASPESLQHWEKLSLAYTESQGHPRLREEIASLYTSIKREQLVVLVPEEGIFLAMHALLSPGDEVIAVHPAYQSLSEIARSIGCPVKPWTIQKNGRTWYFDLDELKELITANTRLLVINFPHNPTGYLPDKEFQAALVDIAAEHGIVIFSDEMYRLLEHRTQDRLPSIGDLYEHSVVLSGMSKAFALPGLRVGWLASSMPGFIEKIVTLKDYTTICNSAPSELLALIGLQARPVILERNLAIIHQNLTAAEEFFSAYPHQFSWLPPLAGSTAFPEWTGAGPVQGFCERALTELGVMIVPADMFDYPGNHFRIGLGRRNFGEALALLHQILA